MSIDNPALPAHSREASFERGMEALTDPNRTLTAIHGAGGQKVIDLPTSRPNSAIRSSLGPSGKSACDPGSLRATANS